MKEDTELGRLMHDFHCTKAEDMYSKVLAERVRVLKETQEGVEIMCKEMDKIYQVGEESGKEKGIMAVSEEKRYAKLYQNPLRYSRTDNEHSGKIRT